jgi:hypothetical protein
MRLMQPSERRLRRVMRDVRDWMKRDITELKVVFECGVLLFTEIVMKRGRGRLGSE